MIEDACECFVCVCTVRCCLSKFSSARARIVMISDKTVVYARRTVVERDSVSACRRFLRDEILTVLTVWGSRRIKRCVRSERWRGSHNFLLTFDQKHRRTVAYLRRSIHSSSLPLATVCCFSRFRRPWYARHGRIHRIRHLDQLREAANLLPKILFLLMHACVVD